MKAYMSNDDFTPEDTEKINEYLNVLNELSESWEETLERLRAILIEEEENHGEE